jgi:hypothetical protein
VEECIRREQRSVKGLLTQEQLIPGLGNSIAQDILFAARLHPKRALDSLGAVVSGRGCTGLSWTPSMRQPSGEEALTSWTSSASRGACYSCPGCQR